MQPLRRNLNINMVFRATFYGNLILNVTKIMRARLVDEFYFSYNQPAIIILGQKLSEAL